MRGFNEQKDSLLNRINKVSVEGPGSIEDQLSQISTEIQSVSKSLHDAVMFLPSYSVKVRTEFGLFVISSCSRSNFNFICRFDKTKFVIWSVY